MPGRLAGKTALVTGATSGIGRGIAEAFAAEAAHVVVGGRNADRGASVVAQIRERGGSADFIQADLSEGATTIAAFAAAAADAAGGHIDILVNNAGAVVTSTTTMTTTEDILDAALAVNVRAPFLLTAALVPAMIAKGSGVVINMGSITGTTGMNGSALYSLTKAAMHSLARSWAAEFGRQGVRVNTIAPGPTAVEWMEAEPIQRALEDLLARVPSGRLSRVDEVAALAVFLASDEAANIQGATIPVDGGMAAVWRPATPPGS